jgi:ABC-type uncharacterized transport system substrate-binding protein
MITPHPRFQVNVAKQLTRSIVATAHAPSPNLIGANESRSPVCGEPLFQRPARGGDPVSDGLVASFNRPGGNVTGATFFGTALIAKRMSLLREILPQVSDVALLVNPKGTLAEAQINEAKAAAQSLGLALQVVNTISESEFDEAFATMSRLKVGAYLASTDPLFGFNGRGLYVTKGLLYGIPAICVGRPDVVAGGLFSYGPNLSLTWRQAGVPVSRFLRGENLIISPIQRKARSIALMLGSAAWSIWACSPCYRCRYVRIAFYSAT